MVLLCWCGQGVGATWCCCNTGQGVGATWCCCVGAGSVLVPRGAAVLMRAGCWCHVVLLCWCGQCVGATWFCCVGAGRVSLCGCKWDSISCDRESVPPCPRMYVRDCPLLKFLCVYVLIVLYFGIVPALLVCECVCVCVCVFGYARDVKHSNTLLPLRRFAKTQLLHRQP